LELQMQIQRNQEQIETNQQFQEQAEQSKTQLEEAIQKLEAKHQEMLNNLQRLTLSQAATRAQNRAADAAESALSASDAAGEAGVDNLEARLQHDRDVADARFSRVIGGMQGGSSEEEQIRLARAKKALEERRAQITEHAAATAPAAT
jgi:hypothetical protein